MNPKIINEKIIFKATSRSTLGKANRSLRKDGLVPANIYGPNFSSLAVSVNLFEFEKIYKKAGETTVIYLEIDGKSYPTLISDLQFHPVTDKILHVDFRKVNLKQKIEAQVPIEFTGEPELVKSKAGIMLKQMEELTVSALPNEIPSSIEVDTTKLTEFGSVIKVSDLPKSETYEITEDEDAIIASLSEHKEEEITPETTVEQPEIIGETKDEGTAPTEEKTE